jgi:superfamily I DNA and/or RNA helicase
MLSGLSLPGGCSDLVGDLWSSFFLVVPSISTTFASIESMFGGLAPGSIGWLLVDEAGQALPQAAVGALMRSKRAIVVGDPAQIEPIVALPNTLTQSICKHFRIDPNRFNAPESSVQTMADAATPHCAEFEGIGGSRLVGIPLLVHRRCADPMFSVSNAVAYGQLMVQSKQDAESGIKACLGPSRWIDIRGISREKWCPEEEAAALELLMKLKQSGLKPDLYVITPFVAVRENLIRTIEGSNILQNWVEDPDDYVRKMVGTVHTVQGREAEAVIFVLGAQSEAQSGAREWAGSRPNLLNVAVTRAREVLYVIGNRQLWGNVGFFRELSNRL